MAKTDDSFRVPMPRPMIQVQLKTGRKISAVQLHVGFTYGTYTKVFQGKGRMREINLELLWNEYPGKVLWGREFPSVLLLRSKYNQEDRKVLPVYKLTALFESSPLREEKGKHSAMVINWLQDEVTPLLSQANRKALREVDWKRMAKDYK
jgi:hypothetical protein